jgi:hypothetical protein
MKKYIYSPHHQGAVLAPLMTEPNEDDFTINHSMGGDYADDIDFDQEGYNEAMEAYNTWLSSPPAFKVRPEDIKDFLEPIDESQFELEHWCKNKHALGGKETFLNKTTLDTFKYRCKDCFLVAIPKKGNESKEQSPSVEQVLKVISELKDVLRAKRDSDNDSVFERQVLNTKIGDLYQAEKVINKYGHLLIHQPYK